MEYVFDIYKLSQGFSDDYPSTKYPEFMHKPDRPYNCLLIDTHDDFLICIPYRSCINHNNAFKFKGTKRTSKSTSASGLDYSKLILIKDTCYLDNKKAIVDKDEYNETAKHISKIAEDVTVYIDTYVQHIKGIKILHPKLYARKYQFSTLPYFHNILKI